MLLLLEYFAEDGRSESKKAFSGSKSAGFVEDASLRRAERDDDDFEGFLIVRATVCVDCGISVLLKFGIGG